MSALMLKQIFIYPVKSLAGIAVSEWQVDEKGLLYDRKWILIGDENQFLVVFLICCSISQMALPNSYRSILRTVLKRHSSEVTKLLIS
jgi:MOSC N-terminal beta barrel domain